MATTVSEGEIRQVNRIRASELRAIKALRLALTSLRDAWGDISNVCWDDEVPEFVRVKRAMSYNVLRALLVPAGECIRLLPDDPVLAEDSLRKIIIECEDIIELRASEDAAETREKVLEPLRDMEAKIKPDAAADSQQG